MENSDLGSQILGISIWVRCFGNRFILLVCSLQPNVETVSILWMDSKETQAVPEMGKPACCS